MRENLVACDVDDVLSGLYPSLCKLYDMPEIVTDIWGCKWLSDKFPDLYKKVEFWENMPILSNPESITFDFDYYLTAIPKNLHSIRKNWLVKNGFPDKPLVCTFMTSKVAIMKKLGIDTIIDDKPATINAVRKAGMTGIQFIPPYMSEYDPNDAFTVRHLSEVKEILEVAKAKKELQKSH